jgi:hypothetical protein
MMDSFNLDKLITRQQTSGRNYLEFLRSQSLSLGSIPT